MPARWPACPPSANICQNDHTLFSSPPGCGDTHRRLGGLPRRRPARSASDLDTVGATLLRQVDPTLTGAGVLVAQPEASVAPGAWQVSPSAVGQPVGLFTYWAAGGSANAFPNSLGAESSHADTVGGLFYGSASGLSPQVAHVDNYDADFFYTNFITRGAPIQAIIINQSFIFDSTNVQRQADAAYDTFAARQNVLFVSGVGNSGPPSAPATAYNGLGVAAFGGSSSVGPTLDNGRAKPDLTAPAGLTSFSTPLVAGAAAVLAQAATRGDGGPGTATQAADIRTLKALLLNGAVKPWDWSHPPASPLDPRYGAGILQVFNAWHELAAGRFAWIESTQVAPDAPHPAGAVTTNLPGLTVRGLQCHFQFRQPGHRQSLLSGAPQRPQHRLHADRHARLEPPAQPDRHQRSGFVFTEHA